MSTTVLNMKKLLASVVIVFVLTNVTGAKHVEDMLETLSLRMAAIEEENRALKQENRDILTTLNELSTRTAEKTPKRIYSIFFFGIVFMEFISFYMFK